MKRILITGSRTWESRVDIYLAIFDWVKSNALEPQEIVIVHGDASRGADRIARDLARSVPWLTEEPHPADWSWGKSGGNYRNTEMCELGADVCLAFIRNNSPGATHCVKEARRLGIPVIIHRQND